MRYSALFIAGLYFFLAATWILVSDQLNHVLAEAWSVSPQLTQTVKGLMFVLLTALMLYWLIQGLYRRISTDRAQYQYLFDQNPNPMLVYAEDSMQILQINQAAQVKYGYSRQQWLQMSLADIRPPEDVDKLKRRIPAIKGQYADSGVWRHRKKDGSSFHAHIYSQAIHFRGQDARMVVVIDVEEQQQAKQQIETLNEQLRQREQFLQSILDHMEDVIWVRQLPDWNLSFVSPASTRKLGLSPQSLCAQGAENLLDRILQADRPAVKRHLGLILELGYHQIEYRYQHPDGSIRRLQDKGILVYDAQQQPLTMQGVTVDLTSLRMAQKDLLDQVKHTTEILNGISDPFFVIDHQWQLIHANAPLLQVCHLSEKGWEGLSAWNILPKLSSQTQINETCRLAMQQRHSMKCQAFDPDRNRWWRVAVYPLTHGGLAIYAQDITEEKKLREQIDRSQQNLLALINNTDDLIALVDPDLNLVLANEAFEQQMYKLFGQKATIKRGESVLTPSLPEDVLHEMESYFQSALQGKRQHITLSGERFGSDMAEVEMALNPIWYHGEVVGIGFFQRDTSERHRRELQILQQNTKLREIAFTQSHDVRKYLANLMGLVMLFDREQLDNPHNLKLLSHLDTMTEDLDALIHRIVDQVYGIEQQMATSFPNSSGSPYSVS